MRRGRVNLAHRWNYLKKRRDMIQSKFDTAPYGRLDEQEQAAANAYLQADQIALAQAERSGPIRPAQALGIVNALVIFALLSWYFRHRRGEGRVFALMLILYPPTRFVLESIRNKDPLNVLHGNWTHNQFSAIALLIVGLILWRLFAPPPTASKKPESLANSEPT